MIYRYSNFFKYHRAIRRPYRRIYRHYQSYSRKNIAVQTISPQIDNVINDYIFQKYQLNQQMQNTFAQLQRQILTYDGDYSNEEKLAFMQTVQKMDMGLVTQSSNRKFKNILKIAKEQNIIKLPEHLEGKFQLKSSQLQSNFYTIGQLLKKYRFGQSQGIGRRIKNSNVILKELQLNQQIQIPIENYIDALRNLTQVQVLNNSQRKLRFQLVNRISIAVGQDISLLIKIGKILNSISHYDFSSKEIDITTQIFSKLNKKILQIRTNIQLMKQIFEGSQYPLNTLNLSWLFNEILTYLINSKKRINSNESHQAFNLLVLANEKIKSYLLPISSPNQLYQQFLLKYILSSGKTKKHRLNINKGLSILLSKNCFSPKMIDKITNILLSIDFSPTATCIYNLIANEPNSILKMKDKSQIDKLLNLTTLQMYEYYQNFIFALALYKSGSQIVSHKNKIQEISYYFRDIKTKLKQMSHYNVPNISKNVYQIYSKQIKTLLYSTKQQLNQDKQMRAEQTNNWLQYENFAQTHIEQTQLAYLLLTFFTFQEKEIENISKLLSTNTSEAVTEILSDRLKNNSNEGLQNFLILPYCLSKQKPYIFNMELNKLVLHLLTRLSKNIRENNLTKPAEFHYWMQVDNILNNFTHHFIESKEALFGLFEQLIHPFSLNRCNYQFSSHYYLMIQKLLSQHSCFSQDDQIKHKIIHQGLFFNMINRGHTIINSIKMQNLDQIFKQKVKYLKNSDYSSKIETINQQTLQIILFNHNNHDLLQLKKEEINQIINHVSIQRLQQYLINFNELQWQSQSPYKLANIVKRMASKQGNSNGFITLTHIQKNKMFIVEQSYIIIMKWIHFFVCKPQEIGDFQTHQTVLTLLSKYDHEKIDLINTQIQTNNSCKSKNSSQYSFTRDLISKYIKILFKQLANNSKKYLKELFYHKLIYTDYLFSRQELNQMAQASQTFLIPDLFFFLENSFLEQERIMIIGKIVAKIENQYQQKKDGLQKIQVIKDYQYRYLKQRYAQCFTINLPQDFFSNQRFSQFGEEDRDFLRQIAKFKNTELIKLQNLGENQIYQINNNYIINILQFKQSSIYEFSYYERLLKAFYGPDIKVTITLFGKHNYFIDISKIIKLNPILNEQQWQQFFFTTIEQNQAHIEEVQIPQEQTSKLQQKKQRSQKKIALKNKKLLKSQYRKEKKFLFFKNDVKK